MKELKNPELFNLKFAFLTNDLLHYQGDCENGSSSIKNERAGKQKFTRKFGKGAIWEDMKLPIDFSNY